MTFKENKLPNIKLNNTETGWGYSETILIFQNVVEEMVKLGLPKDKAEDFVYIVASTAADDTQRDLLASLDLDENDI